MILFFCILFKPILRSSYSLFTFLSLHPLVASLNTTKVRFLVFEHHWLFGFGFRSSTPLTIFMVERSLLRWISCKRYPLCNAFLSKTMLNSLRSGFRFLKGTSFIFYFLTFFFFLDIYIFVKERRVLFIVVLFAFPYLCQAWKLFLLTIKMNLNLLFLPCVV